MFIMVSSTEDRAVGSGISRIIMATLTTQLIMVDNPAQLKQKILNAQSIIGLNACEPT